MSKKKEQQKIAVKTKPQSKFNLFLWALAILIVVAGIAANYSFNNIPGALLAVGWIFLAALVIFLLALTSQGKEFWVFAKASRVEMRKIIWPKREETVRTTAIVAGLVLLTALLLWGVDSILLFLIGLLTGQRG